MLLEAGRELDDPRLEPVVALGALPGDLRQLDLEGLALEADAQGFDLLLPPEFLVWPPLGGAGRSGAPSSLRRRGLGADTETRAARGRRVYRGTKIL